MKLFFIIFLLTSRSSFATEVFSKNITIPSSSAPQILIGQDRSGKMEYIVKDTEGNQHVVSLSFFTNGLEVAIKEAKKVVCDMSVLPESVTISSVVVSVTYNTKQFCTKN